MRVDPPEFNAKNKSETREPVFVIELSFDDLNTDLHYLTSKPVPQLLGNLAPESFWASAARNDTAIIGTFGPSNGAPLSGLGLVPGDTVTAAMFATAFTGATNYSLIISSYDDSLQVLSSNATASNSINDWATITHTIHASATRLLVWISVSGSDIVDAERISVVKGSSAYQGNDYIPNTIINDTLKLISSTSQALNPDKANSNIGSIKFECLDIGLTDLQRTKLAAGDGLNEKRVRLYAGYEGLLWSQFQLVQTQIISSSITFKDGVYTFNCSDIQRSMRKKIFVVEETKITQSFTATDTSITVLDASKFQTVFQVPSASGVTLLRSMQQQTFPAGHPSAGQLKFPLLTGVDEVGFLKFEGEGDDFEIAMYLGKTDNTFTDVHRGVLGTKAVDVTIDATSDTDSAPSIEEYIYLDMPAVKAAYALLTGSLWGHAGKFLPSHWHLNISTDFIKTSAFTNIGVDLWDTADDDAGFPVSIRGAKDVDAKKFIEENIYFMLGLYSPIDSAGELGLKRLGFIGPAGSYVRLLDENNVISYTDLKHDLKSVLNTFIIRWNWDETREIFTRTSVLVDPDSITKHQAQDLKKIELKTLHGSRHSSKSIKFHFDTLRSRYAGPPLRITVTLTPDQNDIEVGDIVRLDLTAFEDFSNGAGTLNRNFEVQKISIDNKTGKVKATLFGSSQRATDLIPEDTEATNNTFLTSGPAANEINATNFPGAVSSAAGTTTITGNITLTGQDVFSNANSIYWCAEDLTIDASATVTITKNTQIMVDGFLQINGTIDGIGGGLTGGVADSVVANVKLPVTANKGKSGVGTTLAQGGMESSGVVNISGNPGRHRFDFVRIIEGHQERRVEGSLNSIDAPILSIDGAGNLAGMPASFMGTSGSSGGGLIDNEGTASVVALGGAGGSGGAGLAIFAKGGAFGAGGLIDLSGGDGLTGQSYTPVATSGLFSGIDFSTGGDMARAGAGAGGAPGGFVFVTIDSLQSFPQLGSAKVNQSHGVCPQVNTLTYIVLHLPADTDDFDNLVPGQWFYGSSIGFDRVLPSSSNMLGGARAIDDTNNWAANSHIVFLDTKSSAIEDEPKFVNGEPQFTLTEFTNTPVTPDGNISTIEVSVTPPPDTNYAYSLVQYRVQGTSRWKRAEPASNESLIELPSNGDVIEVIVSPVSTKGFASVSTTVKTITLTDINGRTDAELAVIYPFVAITNLGLDVAGTVFSGADANFEWDSDNSELAWFNHYEIEVKSGATLLRTEKSVSPFYNYTYDKNVTDFQRITATEGAYFDLEIRVKPVSKHFNDLSALYAGTQVTFTASASTVNDPANLRFILSRSDAELAILVAAQTADWPSVTGVDKPADNADVTGSNTANDTSNVNGTPSAEVINNISSKTIAYTQEAQPTGTVGDLWYQPSTELVKRFDGATWVIFATNGATWGGNILSQPSDSRLLGNMLDMTEWEPGPSAVLTNFSVFGTATTDLVHEPGPEDTGRVVLAFRAVWPGSNAGPALQTSDIPIDADSTYRVSFFVKGALTLAKTRLKVSGDLINLDDTPITTPPLFQMAFRDIEASWYLFVGVVRHQGTAVTINSQYSGIYNVSTGDRVQDVDDIKFEPTATTLALKMEADLFDSGDEVFFYRPRIELLDGTEPTISSLIGTPDDRYVKVQDDQIFLVVRNDGIKVSGGNGLLTTSKVSTGKYRVTHNSGFSGKGIILSHTSTLVVRSGVTGETTTKFDYELFDSSNNPIDSACTLLIDSSYGI